MAGAEEALEALQREAEALRLRLHDERQKLNDADLCTVGARAEPAALGALKPRRVLKAAPAAKLLCADWAPDKRRVLVSAQDGRLTVWDAFAASRELTIATPSTWVLACAWAPSGALLAAGGLDNKLSVFGLGEDEAAKPKRTVGTHAAYVAGCAWPGSDRQLVSGGGDGACALWDVETGALLAALAGHAADVLAVDAAPGAGDVLASAGADRTARVWDARSGRATHAWQAHESDACAVRWHPGGDALATGGDDASVRVFDLRADRELCRLQRPALLFGAASVDWSLSGRLLFAGYGDHTCAVWDVPKGTRLAQLHAHEHRVSRVRVSPDGTALATASWDATLRIWA